MGEEKLELSLSPHRFLIQKSLNSLKTCPRVHSLENSHRLPGSQPYLHVVRQASSHFLVPYISSMYHTTHTSTDMLASSPCPSARRSSTSLFQPLPWTPPPFLQQAMAAVLSLSFLSWLWTSADPSLPWRQLFPFPTVSRILDAGAAFPWCCPLLWRSSLFQTTTPLSPTPVVHHVLDKMSQRAAP
jgi:hypothetical protein